MQLVNVLLGGTLWEDLPTELANEAHTDGQTHEIEMTEESWLFPLFGGASASTAIITRPAGISRPASLRRRERRMD